MKETNQEVKAKEGARSEMLNMMQKTQIQTCKALMVRTAKPECLEF